jgi:hypothetical protein
VSWLRQLLRELHHPLPSASLVDCNNVSDISSPPTPSNISAPSMWKLTYISSGNVSLLGLFVCFTFPQHHSSPMSSQGSSLCFHGLSLQPERSFLRRSGWGGARLVYCYLLLLTCIPDWLSPLSSPCSPIYVTSMYSGK